MEWLYEEKGGGGHLNLSDFYIFLRILIHTWCNKNLYFQALQYVKKNYVNYLEYTNLPSIQIFHNEVILK